MVGNKVEYDILEQVGSVQQAQNSHITIVSLWGHPENSDSGACWPLEASRGQTKHTMVGILVAYGILEQVEILQRVHN